MFSFKFRLLFIYELYNAPCFSSSLLGICSSLVGLIRDGSRCWYK